VCHARSSNLSKYENRYGHRASGTHVLEECAIEDLASILSTESTHLVAADAAMIQAIRHPTTQSGLYGGSYCGGPVRIEFSTESGIYTLPVSDYEKYLAHLTLHPTIAVLRHYVSHQVLKAMGIVRPLVTYHGRTERLRFFVIAERDVPLFG